MARAYRKSTLTKNELVEMGKNVKVIRSILNLTAKEFGVNMGYHISYVSQVEMGMCPFTLDFIRQCYKKYRINPNFLIFGFHPIFISDEPMTAIIQKDDVSFLEGEERMLKHLKRIIEKSVLLKQENKDKK